MRVGGCGRVLISKRVEGRCAQADERTSSSSSSKWVYLTYPLPHELEQHIARWQSLTIPPEISSGSGIDELDALPPSLAVWIGGPGGSLDGSSNIASRWCSSLTVVVPLPLTGVTTQMHYDATQSFFYQVQGRKRFILLPPQATSGVYRDSASVAR